MNQKQQQLYNDLVALTKEVDTFYFKNEVLDGNTYRIFGYRIAQYSDWIKSGALECRGHMFRMNGDMPEALVCLPLPKFFNLNENPFTMEVDYSKVCSVKNKDDGSLISTFIHNDELLFKTKGTLFASQAKDALDWCIKEAPELYRCLTDITKDGYTVNMEWCSPANRVVVKYNTSGLRIINVRDNETFETIPNRLTRFGLFGSEFDANNFVGEPEPEQWLGRVEEFVNSIPSLTGVEGYVLELITGQYIKIKTNWYLTLHRTKESIDIPGRLFESIINETQDDLRSLFADDEYSLNKVAAMEALVVPKYNNIIKQVELFAIMNRGAIRKDYAIKAQELLGDYFGLAMILYQGREPNYKEWAIKHKEHFLNVS